MKSCISEDILLQYLNNQISSVDAVEIIRHLETCESCQTALSEIQQITDSLATRKRPPASKEMLRDYHRGMKTLFASEGLPTRWSRWIFDKIRGLTQIRIITTRLAFGLGLILVGIMMDRFLFHPSVKNNQLTVEQVRLISSLNESDLEILQSFFNDTDQFLESIVNIESESPLKKTEQLSVNARQLMQKTYQMDRYRHASDQMLTDILNQIEFILIESSNLEENDIQTSLQEIRSMVIQARLLMEVRKYQTLFNRISTIAGA